MIEIAPSILSADFANLQADLEKIPNADMIHVDVMDGQFVPNISIGIPVVASLRKVTKGFLDVHLMIARPERYIEDFAKAGADRLTIHVESDTPEGLQKAFDKMTEFGVEKGIALRPITKLSAVTPFLKEMRQLLVMTVEPGFGGQSFMESQVDTIKEAKAYLDAHNPNCQIQVDGGINEATAPIVIAAGATILVAGSAVYGNPNPQEAIETLRGKSV